MILQRRNILLFAVGIICQIGLAQKTQSQPGPAIAKPMGVQAESPGNPLAAITHEELKYKPVPTPFIIASDPPTDPPEQDTCECCIYGTAESEDPDYPSSVPFGLVGSLSSTDVRISQTCLTSSDQGLTAAEWAARLGVFASATMRGLWWRNGLYLGTLCNPLSSQCAPIDSVYHRPQLNIGWSTNINPSVPGAYWLKANLSTSVDYQEFCSTWFQNDTDVVICYVKILPSDPAQLFADDDKDGITNWDEPDYASLSPTNPFSFSDGVLDSVRVRTGTAITNADFDGDGLTGTQEISNGSTAFHADSDHDGVSDPSDDYPLDPTRSISGSSTSDSTPPSITITSPL